MTEYDEPLCEAENRTECESTGAGHVWKWDGEQQDYYCDECGVWHERQED